MVCNADGTVVGDSFFVFFNILKGPDGSVEHLGHNLSGVGDGDDGVVKVNLAGMQASAEKIVFAVSIHEADSRKQSFGQVRNARIRVSDQADGAELAC